MVIPSPKDYAEYLRAEYRRNLRLVQTSNERQLWHLKRENRDSRRILFALALAVAPHPLRISRFDIESVDDNCHVSMAEDITTGDLLIYARLPNDSGPGRTAD